MEQQHTQTHTNQQQSHIQTHTPYTTHIDIHTYTYTDKPHNTTQLYIFAQAISHTFTNTRTYTNTQRYTHTNRNKLSYIKAHTMTYSYAHIGLAHISMYIHPQTHTCTHTYAHSHTYTHAHTHVCTHRDTYV